MSTAAQELDITSLFAVDGIVAVITGGGSGIGRMITEALAVNGAQKIYILGRRIEMLKECASKYPNIVVPLECDVTSKESLQQCVDIVGAEAGFVNLLVCNAGMGGPETNRLNESSSLDEFIESQWEHSVSSFTDTFKVNIAGYWYTTLAFLKLLDLGNQKANVQQKSQVIATCSTLGFSRLAPTGRFAYGQSKAASTHLMKQLSTALVPYHIRTNMIAPGLFPTDMTSLMMQSVGAYAASKGIPEGRPGGSEDVAGIILFLASKAGAYLNGNILVCDGGRLAVVPGNNSQRATLGSTSTSTPAAILLMLALILRLDILNVQETLAVPALPSLWDMSQSHQDAIQTAVAGQVKASSDAKATIDPETRVNGDSGSRGRMLAWLQVLGSFCLYFNTYGIISSFGIYQTYYVSELGFSPSRASLIGSLQSFLVMFANGIAGPLYDAGYCRHILVIGAGTIVMGTFLQSISQHYWHFILTQGICVGFGGGLVAFLGPTILATYFKQNLALASGIGASGGGVAGIIFPFMFRQLYPKLNFGWTVRIMGFLSLVTLALPVLTMRAQMNPTKIRSMLDTTAFQDIPFVIMVTGNFLFLLGAFTPFFYVQVFAIDSSLASRELSFYVLATMNLASVFGRIVPNFLTVFIGPFNMFLCMVFVAAVSAFAYLGVSSLAGLIVASIIFGSASGGAFALQPVVVIGLCPSPQLIGTRLGMASSFLGFALLASNPVAGAISGSGGYTGVWIWTGVTLGAGGLVMAIARGLKSGWSLARKV
ncbi:hypothetical protein F66182_8894 [Fusarium sp. NRRL 66182]|nr:hypothetical protein F66182_8894 [Fusarium sp. NRRL 66182]